MKRLYAASALSLWIGTRARILQEQRLQLRGRLPDRERETAVRNLAGRAVHQQKVQSVHQDRLRELKDQTRGDRAVTVPN